MGVYNRTSVQSRSAERTRESSDWPNDGLSGIKLAGDLPLDGDGEGDVERGGEGYVHEGEDALRPQVHVHRRRPRYDTETLQFKSPIKIIHSILA